MKVSEVMQKSVFSVSEDTPLKEVGRMIFSLGIAGVPVVKGTKLVGIVTEQDILSKMFPSMQDLVEDYVHARDFEAMEKNLMDLLKTPVSKIMKKNITTIKPDTSLMEAQSLMLVNKFSRLPIVDKKNNLLGIISQGDIIRRLLRNEIPKLEQERYAGFIAKYYDLMIDWNKRFNNEFPVLFKLFRQEKIKTVIDAGAWTGEYTIGLVKRGIKVLGLDSNPIMVTLSKEKKKKLPRDINEHVQFELTDFKDLASKISEKFDAAISMGNALPYVAVPLIQLFKELLQVLRDKNGVAILQLMNFEKILKRKDRMLSFKIQKSNKNSIKEHLFIEFFDKKSKDWLLHNVIIFDSDGENWLYKGKTTIPIRYIRKNDIERILKKAGFKKMMFSGNAGEYQGDYGRLSFETPFDPVESDWLNVVAKR